VDAMELSAPGSGLGRFGGEWAAGSGLGRYGASGLQGSVLDAMEATGLQVRSWTLWREVGPRSGVDTMEASGLQGPVLDALEPNCFTRADGRIRDDANRRFAQTVLRTRSKKSPNCFGTDTRSQIDGRLAFT
jgi:hypothetical protein